MAANRKKDWKKELSAKEKVAVIRAEREKEEAKRTQYEKNSQKYEIWANKDERGKMMIDRYNLHGETKNVTSIRQENFGISTPPRSNSMNDMKVVNNVSSSDLLRANTPNGNGHIRRQSMSHAEDIFQKEKKRMNDVRSKFVPKPSSFTPQTIQLLYQNNVLYWPINLATAENLQERFKIAKPYLVLSTAPAGPAAIRFYANEDGTYPINGNGSYTVIVPKREKVEESEDNSSPRSKKKKNNNNNELGGKEAAIQFITDGVFQKKDSLSTVGAFKSKPDDSAIVRTECFVFAPDKKFVFKEYKGEKGVKLRETLSFSGKWKVKELKGGVVKLILKPNKEKGKIARAVDHVQEKQDLYSSFTIAEKFIQCDNQSSYRFHKS